MKTLSINKLAVAVLAASLGFLSLTAVARGQDEGQRYQIQQQAIKAKQQVQAAEAVKDGPMTAAECRRMMKEQGKDASGS